MLKHKIIPCVFFLMLTLFIIMPLLKPGYILALDLVFTPKMRPPGIIINTYLLEWFLYFLNFIFSSQIIEKILFALILFLSGFGMYQSSPIKSMPIKFFAGIFYMINPFVYSRFLYGQLHLLIAYSLLPFTIKTIFDYLQKPDCKKSLKISLWFSLISIIHLRMLSIIGVFFVIGLVIKLLFERSREKWIILFKTSLSMIIGFTILNIYWLWNFLEKNSDRVQALFNVDSRHIQLFKTVSDADYGLFLNVLGLYGFWGDAEGRYIPQKEFVPLWPILISIIIALAIIGLIYGLRKKELRLRTTILFLSSFFSFIFIIGIAHPWFAPFNNFLTEHFILFKGLREPQKFTAILCFGYAYLGSLGIDFIYQTIKKQGKIIIGAFSFLIIILPIVYSPGLFWGFRGQLSGVNYPESWYQINNKLNSDDDDFKVLFLPWHQYLSFGFTNGQIIQNPADQFFDKTIIAGDNLEMGQLYTQSKRTISSQIQLLITEGQGGKDISKNLMKLGIKYIILSKNADWENYDFLNQQGNLLVVYENNDLVLYKLREIPA